MRYVAGADGGGTKTAVTVADETGAVVGTFDAGPLNYNGQDEAGFAATIRDVCRGIAERCGELDACVQLCVGAAGISNPAVSGLLTARLKENGYRGGLILAGDHETALCGAHEGLHGIILIAGTGSICYGRHPSGLTHRAGGFGHLIDDEGSGYSIGRDILSAVVRSADGREAPGILTELVYERLQIGSVGELIGFVYDKRTGKKDIAALAPLLSVACETLDAAALRIADKNAAALAELAFAVIGRLEAAEAERGETGAACEAGESERRWPAPFRREIALAGSVLARNRRVREAVVGRIAGRHPGWRCIDPKRDASYGAMLLALEALRSPSGGGEGKR
ncbi:BadF/BadG/BcrA/BcrD ATPase family protein [Paenibacillus cisolokensis]|uniref:N-acetylglucosamine kinase n=1 Tax=Paenibacillus cisolokensis TaxID=1658519 RepID=UPI003D2A3B84